MLKRSNIVFTLIIVILIFIISIQFNCNRELKSSDIKIDSTLVEIDIPEKEGSFKPVTDLKPIVDTVYKTKYVYIPKESKPDTALLNKYQKENDSLKKELMYKEAITSRSYLETFEDDNVSIDFGIDVTGYLNKVSVPSYTIKPTKAEVYEKTTTITKNKNRFGIEMEVAVPTTLDQSILFKGGLTLDTRRGLRYKAGVDSERRVWGGIGLYFN